MSWFVFDMIKVAFGGILGTVVGTWLTFNWARKRQLIECYVDYFANVPALARENAAPTLSSAFYYLSKASRRLESLEWDPACILAADRLFTRCKTLVSLFEAGGAAGTAAIVELRKQVVDEYEKALGVVRRRHGIQGDPSRAAATPQRRGESRAESAKS